MTALAPARQSIKIATRDLVRAGGGGEASALMTRVVQQKLSDYGNVNHLSFMPVDVVVDLESVTVGLPGHPHVTRALALAQGFGLVPLPAGRTPGTVWLDHIRCVAKEAGDVVARLAGAATTATTRALSPRERGDLRHEVGEAIAALVAVNAALDDDGDIE